MEKEGHNVGQNGVVSCGGRGRGRYPVRRDEHEREDAVARGFDGGSRATGMMVTARVADLRATRAFIPFQARCRRNFLGPRAVLLRF